MEENLLSYHIDADKIATLCLNPSAAGSQSFNRELCIALAQKLTALSKDADFNALIVTSSGPDFALAADIAEWQQHRSRGEALQKAQFLNQIFHTLSQLPVPTVCAIHGRCLGLGLDLALACTWRIASDSAQTFFGYPEITWGLVPAGGGTQRLPKIIGVQAALDMLLTGREVSAKKALRNGLIDACVPPHLLAEQARVFALKKNRKKTAPELTPSAKFGKDLPKWAIEGNALGRKVMWKKARDLVDEKTKGFYPASYKALEVVFEGYDLPLAEGCQLEAQVFSELLQSRPSQALCHLNHASHLAVSEAKTKAKTIHTVGVLGAGQMGGGISTLCADMGLRVGLADGRKEAVGAALKVARTYLTKKVDKRRIQSFEMQKKLAHISPALTPAGFGSYDLVIEAVHEDLALKQQLLQSLEAQADPSWIFASNTSALPISAIASVAKRPEQVIGLHFFAPAEKVPLLEVVVTPQTAEWVRETAINFGRQLGKHVIVVKDSPGFYTTRTLALYLAEALHILAEGCPIDALDHALTQFGFAIGPLALIDEIGFDVLFHALSSLEEAYPHKLSFSSHFAKLAQSGRLGRKNGRGFYHYQQQERLAPDTEVYALCQSGHGQSGHGQSGYARQGQRHSSEAIIERCLMIFINEAVSCLEEQVLASPADGDLAAVYGLGFPPFWGGPFKYCDFVGAGGLVGTLTHLYEKYGERYKPAALLKEQARVHSKFFPEEPWEQARP